MNRMNIWTEINEIEQKNNGEEICSVVPLDQSLDFEDMSWG